MGSNAYLLFLIRQRDCRYGRSDRYGINNMYGRYDKSYWHGRVCRYNL